MRELFAALGHHAANGGGACAFDDGLTRLDYAGLAGRVAAAAEELQSLYSPVRIGILGGNRVESVIAQLAVWHAGKIAVPLPPFLPLRQLRAIAADAGVAHLLVEPGAIDTARQLEIPVSTVPEHCVPWREPRADGAGQIIYTSGTTGQPKGVRLAGGQVQWSAHALAGAMCASRDDSYLSVLPLAMLLETISAIVIPIVAGAQVRLEPSCAALSGEFDGCALAGAVARLRPSCMVLVPHILSEWLHAVARGAPHPPDSLRFVAVGGAPVAPALAERAWRLGIPVYEGYGLSECGSVVALNLPGQRKPGTVGRPLPGLEVTIDGGEIVVTGPSVMDGYLNGPKILKAWRTGDAGEVDADGYLTIRGRIDNVLTTPLGRNISPEWIEACLSTDPRVAAALVTHVAGPHLTALLVPSDDAWLDRATPDDLGALIEARCVDLPDYAVPRNVLLIAARDLIERKLLSADGRIRRRMALASDVWTRAIAVPRAPAVPELVR